MSVEAVDLRTTVQKALANVGHLAEDAGIELLVDVPPEDVIAEVDPRRVERNPAQFDRQRHRPR